MTPAFLLQGLSLFGAGVLTSLTPCVYPMIPITLGQLGTSISSNRQQSYIKLFSFICGLVLMFTILGIAAVQLGEVFGFSSELPWVQVVTGVFLIFAAFISHRGELPPMLTKLANKIPRPNFTGNKTYLQAFTMGALNALIASPCSSPVLGGVLTQIAGEQNYQSGIVLMFTYSLGVSLIFLLLGIALIRAQSIPRSGAWMVKIHKVSVLLLFFAGVFYLSKAFLP